MAKEESNLPELRPPYGDAIDVRAFFRVLWQGKWLLGGAIVLLTVVAVVVALSIPNMYRAEALLAPVADDSAGGLASLAGRYQGLADLAGFNLGERETDKTALGIEVLRSRKFVSGFIRERDILVPLLAAVSWDENTGVLSINDELYDSGSNQWVRRVKPPRSAMPSDQEAYDEFVARLSIVEDSETGFVRVGFEHLSPHVAQQWVEWLIEDLNETIMERDVSEAQRAIEYLYSQIEATSVSELHNVFFGLIEDQTKTIMLAQMSPEYLFRTIDPAIAPETKTTPNRPLIVILGMVLGGLIGLVAVILKGSLGGYPR